MLNKAAFFIFFNPVVYLALISCESGVVDPACMNRKWETATFKTAAGLENRKVWTCIEK